MLPTTNLVLPRWSRMKINPINNLGSAHCYDNFILCVLFLYLVFVFKLYVLYLNCVIFHIWYAVE